MMSRNQLCCREKKSGFADGSNLTVLFFFLYVCVVVKKYDIPVTKEKGRAKLREMFDKNRGVRDIRAIDLLVIKVSISHKIRVIY